MQISTKELEGYLKKNGNLQIIGKKNSEIKGFCSLNHLKDYCITWMKHYDAMALEKIAAYKGILVVCEKFDYGRCEDVKCGLIFTDYPKAVFFDILKQFFSDEKQSVISEKAIVETHNIGKGCSIGGGSYIGPNVKIGDGVCIGNNVSLENRVEIGDNSIIHSNTVIGKDGFGYYKDEQGISIRVPHYGGVLIGHDVEIGANCCVDRGTLDDTVIEDFVKIDNLCHIAHNVIIGKASKVIALSMLGGSCKLGVEAYVAPGTLVKNQISIGECSVVGMGSMVLKDVESGKVVVGSPAKVIRDINEEDKKL